MKYTIPKDAKPIGTEHYCDASFFGLHPITHVEVVYYKVHNIQGASHFQPGDGQPIVWLTLSRKTALPVPAVQPLPLDLFVMYFEPKSLKDEFWAEVK